MSEGRVLTYRQTRGGCMIGPFEMFALHGKSFRVFAYICIIVVPCGFRVLRSLLPWRISPYG